MLRGRFEKARKVAAELAANDAVRPALLGIRFRGLRAKAATDKTDAAGDIRQAQKQLGRTTVGMTENYVRARLESKTDEVANLRSKLQITKRQAARQSHLTY